MGQLKKLILGSIRVPDSLLLVISGRSKMVMQAERGRDVFLIAHKLQHIFYYWKSKIPHACYVWFALAAIDGVVEGLWK